MIYAGIGSRETPDDILKLMSLIATRLNYGGWTLRSGGAPGADSAFFHGACFSSAGAPIEVYFPWPGFNDEVAPFYVMSDNPPAETYEIAKQFHPAWYKLTQGGRRLMARNTQQILGSSPGISPKTDAVICWTEGGKLKGGTAQALRIAEEYKIPVYNLGDPLTAKLLGDII